MAGSKSLEMMSGIILRLNWLQQKFAAKLVENEMRYLKLKAI